MSWCRAERLPLHMASSIFLVHVLPSIAWGSEFLAASPTASRVWIVRQWGRFLLGWPSGSPNVGVLVELGWAEKDLFRSPSFQAASRTPGTCVTLGAPLPNACGVTSGSPPSVSQRPKSVISLMMVCTIALEWALHLCRLSISSLCILRWWWPRSCSLRTGVAQPGICSCLSITVSVTLLLEIWCTDCPSAHGSRICERSGAVAFQSRQFPCGPGTRGFSTQLHSSIPQGHCALM